MVTTLLLLVSLVASPSIKLKVDKQVGIVPTTISLSAVVPPHPENRRIIIASACDGFPMEEIEIPLAGDREQTSQYLRKITLREKCVWTFIAALVVQDERMIPSNVIKVEVR